MTFDAARRQVVLFGGYSDQEGSLGDTWTWDGTDWTAHEVPSPPAQLLAPIAYDAARRRVVLLDHDVSKGQSTWIWNGQRWRGVRPDPAPPINQFWQGMAYDAARQETILFGGAEDCFEDYCEIDDNWVWDGSTWTFEVPPMNATARYLHSMAFDGRTRTVMMFGGTGYLDFETRGDTWLWDGTAWSLQTPSSSPPARWGAGMAYDARSRLVVLFGGQDWTEQSGYVYLGDTWVWNGSAWEAAQP